MRTTEDRLAADLGFWSATACLVTSIGFFFGVAANATVVPPNTWTEDLRAYAATFSAAAMAVTVVPSLLIVPSVLGLVAAVHVYAAERRRSLTLLALAFAVTYAAILGTHYYLQLSYVRASITAGDAASVAALLMDNPRGAFWTIETLGYGLQGIALGLLAAAFTGSGSLERWLRGSLLLVGASGLLSLVTGIRGVELGDPLFIAGGAAWGIGFPLSSALAAAFFRRHRSRPA